MLGALIHQVLAVPTVAVPQCQIGAVVVVNIGSKGDGCPQYDVDVVVITSICGAVDKEVWFVKWLPLSVKSRQAFCQFRMNDLNLEVIESLLIEEGSKVFLGLELVQ